MCSCGVESISVRKHPATSCPSTINLAEWTINWLWPHFQILDWYVIIYKLTLWKKGRDFSSTPQEEVKVIAFGSNIHFNKGVPRLWFGAQKSEVGVLVTESMLLPRLLLRLYPVSQSQIIFCTLLTNVKIHSRLKASLHSETFTSWLFVVVIRAIHKVYGTVALCLSRIGWPHWWGSGFKAKTCRAALITHFICSVPGIHLPVCSQVTFADAQRSPRPRELLALGGL